MGNTSSDVIDVIDVIKISSDKTDCLDSFEKMLNDIKHDTDISYLKNIIYCNMDKIEYGDKQNPRQFNCKKITRKKTDYYKYKYDISSKYDEIKKHLK
jgi:hypothetical protein